MPVKAVLDEIAPDVVITATGAAGFVPEVPGVRTENAITAQKLLKNEEVILGGSGKLWTDPGAVGLYPHCICLWLQIRA